jgi:hypothetical protein
MLTRSTSVGHTCVSVDDLDAACKRFEDMNVSWKKRLTDGRMKNVAFILGKRLTELTVHVPSLTQSRPRQLLDRGYPEREAQEQS